MGIGYHHNGLLVLSGIGLALLVAAYLITLDETLTITLTAIVVILVMLLQLFFDYRSMEENYLFLTTSQTDRKQLGGFSERIKYKWPTLMIAPLFFIASPLVVAGAFFLSWIMWFPLQRKMYLRSCKEFVSSKASTK